MPGTNKAIISKEAFLNKSRGTVLKPWVEELPWKMQSALFSSLRGPEDQVHELKQVGKWVRSVIQKNADPTSTYMADIGLPDYKVYVKRLEYTSSHYGDHMMHVLEIIGYFHNEVDIAEKALTLYHAIVERKHLHPETKEEIMARFTSSTPMVDESSPAYTNTLNAEA